MVDAPRIEKNSGLAAEVGHEEEGLLTDNASVERSILSKLKRGDVSAVDLFESRAFPESFAKSEAFVSAVKEALIRVLPQGDFEMIARLVLDLPLSPEVFVPEVKNAAKEGMRVLLAKRSLEKASYIAQAFDLSVQDKIEAVEGAIFSSLNTGSLTDVKNLSEQFNVSSGFFVDDRVRAAARRCGIASVAQGEFELSYLMNRFKLKKEDFNSEELDVAFALGTKNALHSGKAKRVVDVLSRFSEHNPLPSLLEKDEVSRKAIEDYEEHVVIGRQFAELNRVLNVTNREIPLDPSKAEKVLKELLADHMPIAARECLHAMEAHGAPVLNEELKNRVALAAAQEEESRKNRTERRERPEGLPKSAEEMVALFYVASKIEQQSDLLIELVRKSGLELTFSTMLRLKELQAEVKGKVDGVETQLLEYLLYAVHAELGHQTLLKDSESDVTLSAITKKKESSKTFFQSATDEEISSFFHQAQARFIHDGWKKVAVGADYVYGGPKWAEIARSGAELTHQHHDIPSIDHIFSLVHNGAPIFDKNDALIGQDPDKLKEILDLKYQAIGEVPELARLLHDALPPTQTRDKMTELADRWTNVRRSVENTFVASGKNEMFDKYFPKQKAD